MKREDVARILEDVRAGQTSVEQALEALAYLPFADFGDIKLDLHREMRTGVPEVIYAPGKTARQIAELVQRLGNRHPVFITKADPTVYEAVKEVAPAFYHERARIVVAGETTQTPGTGGRLVVVSAGTGDIPVAEEAAVTAEVLGCPVQRIFDVGAAGIHRLLEFREILQEAHVLVVTAGMDGVLPGIAASLFAAPVIALPTSVGYGTGLHGYAALLTMLNSCAPGVATVNIDNGFGAGVLAYRIMRKVAGNR